MDPRTGSELRGTLAMRDDNCLRYIMHKPVLAFDLLDLCAV